MIYLEEHSLEYVECLNITDTNACEKKKKTVIKSITNSWLKSFKNCLGEMFWYRDYLPVAQFEKDVKYV